MNARERFHATMHYLPRDRSPIMDFGFWEETLFLWEEQGLPHDVDTDAFFGMDPQWILAPINVGLHPPFRAIVMEDHGETEIVRDSDGVVKERSKFASSIPRHLRHTLRGRASWEVEFRWRLNGCAPHRYPRNWPQLLTEYLDPGRDYPLGIQVGSLYGWIRNWMGLEGVSMLIYDDRALFEEMVETIADCVIQAITPALEAGIRFEYALLWEDMCYRAGPLLSPKVFAQVLVPRYRRITELLRQHGTDIVIVDCDGDITQLLPLWLEAGVNTMFPLEIGAWGADPLRYRKEYGTDLRMIGGFSKQILASTREEITREVERLAPLVEEGGYIPTPDHRVPPDVPLRNYLYYLSEARRCWGKNLPNLRPMGVEETATDDGTRFAWHLAEE